MTATRDRRSAEIHAREASLSDVRNLTTVESEPRCNDAAAVPRLVDVPVWHVLLSPDCALNRARQRVVAERGRGDQNYAAHGSSPVA
jgi:hypothetical protein